MKRHWHADELAEHWTLTAEERALLPPREDANRLGFALLLKFLQIEGRFPQTAEEIPTVAIDYMARQLGVTPTQFSQYDWHGRTIKRHRVRIREVLGIRPTSVQDAAALTAWLSDQDDALEAATERLAEVVYQRCRELRLEPPAPGRVERIVRSAVRTAQDRFCDAVFRALPASSTAALDQLVTSADPDADEQRLPLYALKADPGGVSLESLLTETAKLHALRDLGLPPGLFDTVSPHLVMRFRQRAAAEPPRELRAHAGPLRYTLLAALCQCRAREITDNLVDLLIGVIHKIGVRAERKVQDEMLAHLQRVPGKTNLLYQFAGAALSNPDGRVREVIFPVAGEQLLHDLVAEGQSSGPSLRKRIHTVMCASYQNHYRRMVPRILAALEFRSNNVGHQPVIQALELIRQNAGNQRRYYQAHFEAPIDGVVRPKWRDLLIETTPHGEERVHRINYEICALETLREKLRCKEIWVVGADRWRNPDEDLPADFDQRRDRYYAALDQPRDAQDFIEPLRAKMITALATLDRELPCNRSVKLLQKAGGWIQLTPLAALSEPPHVDQIKAEVTRQWPMTSLLDILKETDLRVGFTERFSSLASREGIDRATLQKRLLLCLYGLGTNTGLKRLGTGEHGETYRDLLYIRRRFLHSEGLRQANTDVVNALLQVRQAALWGEGTTSCASDAKKFGAWDQNLMTEWHVRYGGPGIMIYWHVEKKSACIYSQLKTCSSSEVAAMIEGVLRHCTDAEITRNYVDSHGQSEVAFAFCYLLGFDLLPRLKRLHAQRLYRPEAGHPDAFPHLQPVLTRPIRWELIAQQYDEMIKFATALRLGTAEAEAILRRFTRANVQHPTYRALAELGKAVKTIFLCQYLGSEELRREIHAGLCVIENWNSANGFIFYGRGGEIATNRRDDQQLAMLSLQLLQNCLVYVNTLMVQQVLDEPEWQARLTSSDLRALTPLFYTHVNPYGVFDLDMTRRIPLKHSDDRATRACGTS